MICKFIYISTIPRIPTRFLKPGRYKGVNSGNVFYINQSESKTNINFVAIKHLRINAKYTELTGYTHPKEEII
jgi:hypothetical protein